MKLQFGKNPYPSRIFLTENLAILRLESNPLTRQLRGAHIVNLRLGNLISYASTIPLRATALFSAMLLLAAALAACGGEESSSRERGATTSRPKASAEANPTRQGILGHLGNQPTTVPEATAEAEPTRQGILGRFGSQPAEVEESNRRASNSLLFDSFSFGNGHGCGLKTDGSVLCFGYHRNTEHGAATAPSGSFTSVDAGDEDTCGVSDGSIICWGRWLQGRQMQGSFQSVSVGKDFFCGLTRDGTVTCSEDEYELPDGRYTSIASSYRWTCGVTTEESIACSGTEFGHDGIQPVEGRFDSVSVGESYACALRTDGSAVCTGRRDGDWDLVPDSRYHFISVSSASDQACGVKQDSSSIVCWSFHDDAEIWAPEGQFKAVSIAGWKCAIRIDDTLACWDMDGADSNGSNNVVSMPEGDIISMDTFKGRYPPFPACWVYANGSLECWGVPGTLLPSGEFSSVSIGAFGLLCLVKYDGSLFCLGLPEEEQSKLQGTFQSVSAGGNFLCGLSRDGFVACWGENDSGQATPPEGEFASISVGEGHACGVRADGAVACWGENDSGQATPPEGEFASISVGEDYACGVRADGAVACWGENDSGQATPPEGEFASISVGESHVCGVRADGAVACWGQNSAGQATPPEGKFASVSAGYEHTCGVRDNGHLHCWGAFGYSPGVLADE